jgi:hypothetical protein
LFGTFELSKFLLERLPSDHNFCNFSTQTTRAGQKFAWREDACRVSVKKSRITVHLAYPPPLRSLQEPLFGTRQKQLFGGRFSSALICCLYVFMICCNSFVCGNVKRLGFGGRQILNACFNFTGSSRFLRTQFFAFPSNPFQTVKFINRPLALNPLQQSNL